MGEADVSGLLLAGADEAWAEEEGVYEIETGKKLSLEQLVDFYVELAEDGWLSMIVQPFRQEDLVEGCTLLREKKPDLRLVFDFSQSDIPPASDGSGFSCALNATGSVALMLQQYAELAPQWQQADGCGRLTIIDPQFASAIPSAMTAVLAARESDTVYLANDIADADLAKMSAQVD